MPDAPTDLALAPGTRVADRFVVRALHHASDVAAVHRAEDRDGTAVALKVLRDNDIDAARQRDVLRTLRHPGLAELLDHGALGERAWVAHRWVDGVTLGALLDARGRASLSPSRALDTLRAVFEALALAHAAGIAHRDVKPDNLLCAQVGGAPALIDFDGARLVSAARAPGGDTTGPASTRITPRYAAPEQLARGRTGPWTDVHALALLVTELVTGRPAYRASSGAALLPEVFLPTRPTPGRVGVAVGPWEAELARALALDPAARHRDAGELLRALTATAAAADAAFARSPHGAETPIAPEIIARPRRAPSRGAVIALALALTAAAALALTLR